MAIVKYKCDVCKREVGLLRNIHGIETPSRCIITHGCRGKLYFEELLPDFAQGKPSENVEGLEDWRQRKVLYNHEQPIKDIEWTIPHNLGNSVSVSVFVDRFIDANNTVQEEANPESIIIDSADQIRVQFAEPQSGVAQLVARASDPDLLQPKIIERAADAIIRKLTVSGQLTIATRDPITGTEDPIFLDVEYTTPQETQHINIYSATTTPNLLSPWSDTSKVIINGASYSIRGFDIQIPKMVDGTIINGSTIAFTLINDNAVPTPTIRAIEPTEVLILLAEEPQEVNDKNTVSVIDVTSISAPQDAVKLVYNTGEFYADITIEQSVYPPIRPAI